MMETTSIEEVLKNFQNRDKLQKVLGLDSAGNVALSLLSSIQSLPYRGRIPANFDANNLSAGIWYNLTGNTQGTNFPFGYGFVVVHTFEGDTSAIQVHFSTSANFAIRLKWGGVWFVKTFIGT